MTCEHFFRNLENFKIEAAKARKLKLFRASITKLLFKAQLISICNCYSNLIPIDFGMNLKKNFKYALIYFKYIMAAVLETLTKSNKESLNILGIRTQI